MQHTVPRVLSDIIGMYLKSSAVLTKIKLVMDIDNGVVLDWYVVKYYDVL